MNPDQRATSPRLSDARRVFELSRPCALVCVYVFLCVRGWWLRAAPVALGCFLAGFVLLHDAMHGALGLSRRANDLVIAVGPEVALADETRHEAPST